MTRFFYKRSRMTFVFCLLQLLAAAQDTSQSISSTFNDTMRSHDKIYVVMAVCLLILIVFFLYLIRIDLKISRKEKEI